MPGDNLRQEPGNHGGHPMWWANKEETLAAHKREHRNKKRLRGYSTRPVRKEKKMEDKAVKKKRRKKKKR